MAAYDLKNPGEVKEYLKNLHIEYKFGCYSEKNPEVCHLLGDFTESVKKDYKKAGIIYKMTCDDYNFPKSCTKYGNYKLVGKGCNEDIVEAYKYMSRGCELKDERGCVQAGALAVSDKEVGEKDRATQVAAGVRMLTQACTDGVEKACFYLSGIYLSGIVGHVEKNMKEAYKLSLKCCELGNPYACANVAQMHERGDGVQKNPDLAETFKQRARILENEMHTYKRQLKFQQGIQD